MSQIWLVVALSNWCPFDMRPFVEYLLVSGTTKCSRLSRYFLVLAWDQPYMFFKPWVHADSSISNPTAQGSYHPTLHILFPYFNSENPVHSYVLFYGTRDRVSASPHSINLLIFKLSFQLFLSLRYILLRGHGVLWSSYLASSFFYVVVLSVSRTVSITCFCLFQILGFTFLSGVSSWVCKIFCVYKYVWVFTQGSLTSHPSPSIM